jgi:hypothetical protein
MPVLARVEDLPEHLRPYACPCPLDLELVLRAARSDSGRLRVAGLKCRCGEAGLLVGVAYNWEVVDAACPSCGHEFSIYDPKYHGRSAVNGENDYDRPPFESVPFGCMCRMMVFELAVAVDCADEVPGTAEGFLFIAVGGKCMACGMDNVVFDAPCD